jgi:type I restriction enzyme, S subunit
MRDGLWELPSTWVWTQCSEMATVVGGGTPPTTDDSNFCTEGGIPWLTPADLTGYNDRTISRGRRNLTPKGFRACGAQLLPKGSVLFSSRAPIGYCAIAANEIATNQGFKSLLFKGPDVSAEYIYYYLKASKEYAESLSSGTTFLELSGSRMGGLKIPLPPLAEQKRIVAKLDTLLAHVVRAREELARILGGIDKKTEVLLIRLEQALFFKAFRGELVSQDPADEPATEILARLRAQRGAEMPERKSTRAPRRKTLTSV